MFLCLFYSFYPLPTGGVGIRQSGLSINVCLSVVSRLSICVATHMYSLSIAVPTILGCAFDIIIIRNLYLLHLLNTCIYDRSRLRVLDRSKAYQREYRMIYPASLMTGGFGPLGGYQ